MKPVLPPPAPSTWIPGAVMSATNAEAAFVVALMIPGAIFTSTAGRL